MEGCQKGWSNNNGSLQNTNLITFRCADDANKFKFRTTSKPFHGICWILYWSDCEPTANNFVCYVLNWTFERHISTPLHSTEITHTFTWLSHYSRHFVLHGCYFYYLLDLLRPSLYLGLTDIFFKGQKHCLTNLRSTKLMTREYMHSMRWVESIE
jgi:hypothetical protein